MALKLVKALRGRTASLSQTHGPVTLAANLSGQGSLDADLSVTRGLEAALTGSSSLTGRLDSPADVPLAANLSGSSSLVGTLGSTKGLQATLSGSSSLLADLTIGVADDTYESEVRDDSPTVYYRLGEASGTGVTDRQAAHNGTYVNTPTLGQAGAIDDSDTAVLFAAAQSERVDSTTLGTLGSSLLSATAEMWVKTTSTTPLQALFGTVSTGTSVIWAAYLNTDRFEAGAVGKTMLHVRGANGLTTTGEISANIYDGEWHHFVWVVQGSGQPHRVWVDGNEVTVTAGSTQAITAASFDFPIMLAARNVRGTPDRHADVSLDEVAFYPTRLSQVRIQEHYTAAGLVIPDPPDPPPDPPPPTTFAGPNLAAGQLLVSWAGDTLNGANDVWVPHGCQAGWVTPDGTCYTATQWEENGRVIGAFKNGQVLGPRTQEASPVGGFSVCADSTYVYNARLRFGGGGVHMRRWPRSSFDVVQGAWNGRPEPSMLIGGGSEPPAIAVNGGELFVVYPNGAPTNDQRDYTTAQVRVYNAAAWNGTIVRQWNAPRWRRICFDGSGNIWALIQRSGATPPVIQKFNRSGVQMSGTISGVADPTSVWWHNNLLYVGDNGPDQNVKIFNQSGVLQGTFGVTGGFLAGPVKGAQGPLRFDCPIVCGLDSSSNIYIASIGCSLIGERRWSFYELGRFLVMESYQLNGTRNWRLEGLEFIDRGSLDVATGDLFTLDEWLEIRPSQNPPYNFKARTTDIATNPSDNRNHTNILGKPYDMRSCWVRTVAGKRYMFAVRQTGGGISVWRLGTGNNHIFKPANPIAVPTEAPTVSKGMWVDSNANCWEATRAGGIRRYRFQDPDPMYSTARKDSYPMPAPFQDLRRCEYYPATDVMYLGGYTFAGGDQSYDGPFSCGNLIARYDGWLNGARTLRWQTTLAPNNLAATGVSPKSRSFSAAGDYVFVGWQTHTNNVGHYFKVYSALTGAYVRDIDPVPSMGLVGWLDMLHSVEAFKVGNVYCLVVEEGAKAKNLLIWWRP